VAAISWASSMMLQLGNFGFVVEAFDDDTLLRVLLRACEHSLRCLHSW
jgi:hypothetical protein